MQLYSADLLTARCRRHDRQPGAVVLSASRASLRVRAWCGLAHTVYIASPVDCVHITRATVLDSARPELSLHSAKFRRHPWASRPLTHRLIAANL
eukprot:6206913-Pleurochrysis_carterae.AAC.3